MVGLGAFLRKGVRMKASIKVGDLVISHTKTLARAMVGRPALVIDIIALGNLRLKVGKVEWWDHRLCCEKVSE
jgi:hypothetical protein